MKTKSLSAVETRTGTGVGCPGGFLECPGFLGVRTTEFTGDGEIGGEGDQTSLST